MKRISAIAIALLVLCLSLVPMTAFAAEEKPLWITHYNDNTTEGAGSIFTTEYSGAVWWIHFAFAPTDVEDVYTITAISNGIADGSATALAIPEGGFVFALNVGNDYATINGNPNDIDYTSPNCSNAINDYAANWMVGMNIKFNGLDLEGFTVPTSTPDVKWYDDAYVCTATYSVYEGEVGSGDESSEATEESSEAVTESSEVVDESSEAEESSEASAESSEAATESSETESSAANSSATDSSAAEDEGGLGIWIWVIIGVAVVVVVVVVIVVAKKK